MVGTMAARNQAHPPLLADFRPRPLDFDGERSQPVLARRAIAGLGGALQDGRGIAQRSHQIVVGLGVFHHYRID